jgi:ADP-glucose pyrophosphorylase
MHVSLMTAPDQLNSIAPDPRIERSILWEGATIGSGATLRDTIVGEEFYVREGAALENAVVANDSPA